MNSTAMCSTCRGVGSVRMYLACDSSCDENKQTYHTGSVAARVNKDRAFCHTPGRRCQACYWCIIEDSWKRQHHNRHMEQKDTKSCREFPGTSTRTGTVQMEHPWTDMEEFWPKKTEEGHKVFFSGKEDKHEHSVVVRVRVRNGGTMRRERDGTGKQGDRGAMGLWCSGMGCSVIGCNGMGYNGMG